MSNEEIMKEYREDLECNEDYVECMTCPHYKDCLKDAMEK